ncbi:hypothetical protein D3C78_898050 [compost metagenome]
MSLLGGVAGMEQDNITGMCSCYNTIDDFVSTNIHPVQRIRIPLNDFIIEFLGYTKDSFVKIAVWQANQIRLFA